MLQITWLGESGFILEDEKKVIVLDPYLSDSLSKRKPDMKRLLPPDPQFVNKAYDLLLLTHAHTDHTDPETIKMLLQANPEMIIAGPLSSYLAAKSDMAGATYVQMSPDSLMTIGQFQITAQIAIHSDRYALGYLIKHESRSYYFSGDTALLCNIQDRIPHNLDVAFLCFNGGNGKNLDIDDAVRFAQAITPSCVVPFHYGVLPSSVSVEAFEQAMTQAGFQMVRPEYSRNLQLPFDRL
jgi:L-ascorbate metabolism protein UlaG (beta-lactamase superfamily)